MRVSFSDDPADGAFVKAILPGNGYQDRANDLYALASLYERQRAVISRDPKHFRATDAEDALRLSRELLEALRSPGVEGRTDWAKLMSRAWTLLHGSYEELRAAGRYLWRGAPDVESWFPSLVTRSREAAVRGSTEETPGEEKGGGKPSPDGGGTPNRPG